MVLQIQQTRKKIINKNNKCRIKYTIYNIGHKGNKDHDKSDLIHI